MSSAGRPVCFGIHAVTALLEHHHSVSALYIGASSSQRLARLEQMARTRGIEVVRCERERLDRLSGYGTHQGVVAEYESGKANPPATLKDVMDGIETDTALVLVLDHLHDPHNLGACLRTAECAGVDAVILPKRSACPVNHTVSKVASGAVEPLNIVSVSNIVNALDVLKRHEFWIYGTSERGDAELYDVPFRGRIALVVGNEGKGMKRLVEKACDALVRIPVSGQVQSLNASVATGICLYEIRRQFSLSR